MYMSDNFYIQIYLPFDKIFLLQIAVRPPRRSQGVHPPCRPNGPRGGRQGARAPDPPAGRAWLPQVPPAGQRSPQRVRVQLEQGVRHPTSGEIFCWGHGRLRETARSLSSSWKYILYLSKIVYIGITVDICFINIRITCWQILLSLCELHIATKRVIWTFLFIKHIFWLRCDSYNTLVSVFLMK